MRKIGHVLIVLLLTSVNLLNWMDRGLIAGAGSVIKGCVPNVKACGHIPKVSHCPDSDRPDEVDTCSSRCMVCGDICRESGETVQQTGFGINDFELCFHYLTDSVPFSNCLRTARYISYFPAKPNSSFLALAHRNFLEFE